MFQLLSSKLPWDLAQTKWSGSINAALSLPILNGNLIQNIALTGSTPKAINHGLQRLPQGWFLIDNTANCAVWRSSAFTIYSLTLESSATTTISIWVF